MASDSSPPPPPPPPPPTPPPAPISAVPPPAFSLTISEKLIEDNFLLWKQQIEPIIKAHQLHRFLVTPEIPIRYLTESDRLVGTLNPEYTRWELQDSLLLSWLQSSVTAPILTRLIGCVHAWQLWEKLHNHFQSKTRARARMLRTELRNTKKEDRSISEFVLRVKALVDALYSIGDAVSPQEQMDVILEGLPEEYDSLINLVSTRYEDADLDELEALLLAQEVRLDRYKQSARNAAAVNVASVAAPPATDPTPQANIAQNQQLYSASPSQNYRGGRNGRGRGRGGRSAVQCQLCSKFGHDAFAC